MTAIVFLTTTEQAASGDECRSCGYPNLPGGPGRPRRPDGHADFCPAELAS